MTERFGKADARRAFERLCKMMDKQIFDGSKWPAEKQIGAWKLDCAPVYGGYVVECIDNEGLGVSQPFGCRRRSARELWEVVHFLEDALQVLQKGGHLTPPA